MAQLGTKFFVGDNSGARFGCCINVIGKGNKRQVVLGSFVLITLKKFINRYRTKKKIIYIGLVIILCKWNKRSDGILIRFFVNRILVFNKQLKFLGTRIYGGIASEIRVKDTISKKSQRVFQKVISYCIFLV